MGLERPSPSLVQRYVIGLQNNQFFVSAEEGLKGLFGTYPRNDSLPTVLLKVAALNSLYGTNIYAVFDVAKHVQQLNIDSRLLQNDLSLIDEIAVVSIGGKTRRNYSFATKYCSWHKPDVFPIYDSFVDQLLWGYKNQDGFAKFYRYQLHNYITFVNVMRQFQNFYGLEGFSFREIDKFLWSYGQELR